MNDNKKKPNTITMSETAWNEVEKLAEKDNRSISNYIETLIISTSIKQNTSPLNN